MITIIQNMEVIPSRGFKADRRIRFEIRVIATMFAAIFLGGTEGAWALPVGFGTNCYLSGGTFAESGNPGVLGGDTQTLTGSCGSYSSLSGQSYLTTVPIPAAVWLFGSGLLGLIGVARRKTRMS